MGRKRSVEQRSSVGKQSKSEVKEAKKAEKLDEPPLGAEKPQQKEPGAEPLFLPSTKMSPEEADEILKKPFEQILLVYDKRIRNLEKRKMKLVTFAKKKESGETLSPEQVEALSKMEEVEGQLELLAEIQKTLHERAEIFEKTVGKDFKRKRENKKQKADERLFESLLRYQEVAKAFQDPLVRRAFTEDDDEKLTPAELSMLDGLAATQLKWSPRKEHVEWSKAVDASIFNWVLVVTASESAVLGKYTGNEVEELLERLSKSEKLERTIKMLKTNERDVVNGGGGESNGAEMRQQPHEQSGAPHDRGSTAVARSDGGKPPATSNARNGATAVKCESQQPPQPQSQSLTAAHQKTASLSSVVDDTGMKMAHISLIEQQRNGKDMGSVQTKLKECVVKSEESAASLSAVSSLNGALSCGFSSEVVKKNGVNGMSDVGGAVEGSEIGKLDDAQPLTSLLTVTLPSGTLPPSLPQPSQHISEIKSTYGEFGSAAEEGGNERKVKEPSNDGTEPQKSSAVADVATASAATVNKDTGIRNGSEVVVSRAEEREMLATQPAGTTTNSGTGRGSGRWRDRYPNTGDNRRRNYQRFGQNERGGGGGSRGGGPGGGYRGYGPRRRGDYRTHPDQAQDRPPRSQQPLPQQQPQPPHQEQQFYEDMRPYDPNQEPATAFSAFSVGGTVYFTPASPPLVYASPAHYVGGPPAPFTQLTPDQIPTGAGPPPPPPPTPQELDYSFSGAYSQFNPYQTYE